MHLGGFDVLGTAGGHGLPDLFAAFGARGGAGRYQELGLAKVREEDAECGFL